MRYVSNGECVECHQYNHQNIYKKTMRHLENAMAEIDRLEKELL